MVERLKNQAETNDEQEDLVKWKCAHTALNQIKEKPPTDIGIQYDSWSAKTPFKWSILVNSYPKA